MPRKAGNVATPHARVDGSVRPIAPFDSDNTNPAGGINSNADDMAKWLLVQLAEGKLADGTRAHSQPATARQLTTLVTPIPIGEARRSCATCVRTSTATGSASACATIAATSSSRTPAGCPATSRRWR